MEATDIESSARGFFHVVFLIGGSHAKSQAVQAYRLYDGSFRIQ